MMKMIKYLEHRYASAVDEGVFTDTFDQYVDAWCAFVAHNIDNGLMDQLEDLTGLGEADIRAIVKDYETK